MYTLAEQILVFLDNESRHTSAPIDACFLFDRIQISLSDMQEELQKLADNKFINIIEVTGNALPYVNINSNGRKYLNGSMQKKDPSIINNYGTINHRDSHNVTNDNSSYVGGNVTNSQMGITGSDVNLEMSRGEKQQLDTILEQIKIILKNAEILPDKKIKIQREIKFVENEKNSLHPNRHKIKERLHSILDSAGGVDSLMSIVGIITKFLS